MPQVSIIIPCHNYGKLLGETLENLEQQHLRDWQCLIIDDGSLDNTREVAESFAARDARFVYLYQKNAGVSVARNTGLKAATGKYIQFLDADDLLVPEKLLTQVAFLTSQPSIDIVYGDVRYFLDGNREVLSKSFDMLDNSWMPGVSGTDMAVLTNLVSQNVFVISSPLLRANSLTKVGGFNAHLRAFEDWDFWLKCAYNGLHFHFDADPKCLTLIRVHQASVSQKIGNMRYGELMVRLDLRNKLKAAGLMELNANRIKYLLESLVVNRLKNKEIGSLVKNAFSVAKAYLHAGT